MKRHSFTDKATRDARADSDLRAMLKESDERVARFLAAFEDERRKQSLRRHKARDSKPSLAGTARVSAPSVL